MENCYICCNKNKLKKCKTCNKKCCYDCKTIIFVNNKSKCFWCIKNCIKKY